MGIPETEDGNLSDHDYFCIHGDLFDIILSIHQDRNILWRFISNQLNENKSQIESIEIHDDRIQKKKRSTTKYSTKHTLQKKRQKKLTIGRKHFITLG